MSTNVDTTGTAWRHRRKFGHPLQGKGGGTEQLVVGRLKAAVVSPLTHEKMTKSPKKRIDKETQRPRRHQS